MPQVAAFIAGAIGAAVPVGGVTAATFGAWAAGTGFASFLSTTVVGKLLTTVAVSALSVALQSAPKTPSDPGIRTEQTMTGGTTPASFILGKFATEGQLVAPPMSYRQEGDIPNSLLVYVIEIGDIPGQTLEGMIIDGEPVTIGDTLYTDALGTTHGYPIEGKHDGYAWVTYYDGTQTTADQRLVDHFGTDPERPWSTDMVGEGICYAVVTFRINRKLYSGFPKVRFIMGGIPLYDPRKDSTVGGSGSHRWNDSATWEPSENNAVQAYNILRGITLPGGEVWGGDMDADDLPLSNWFAAMNAADASIEATDGVFEPTYRSSYEVFVSDEPASVIEELMKAASGQLAEIGGVWKVRLGGPGLPVFFFSDDDVNIRESQSFEPFPGVGEIYNGVHASYPDPDSAWNPNDAPPRYNASYEADDGDRRLVADLTLPAAPYANQVQRLMVAYIEEERRMRRHTLTLAPEAIPLEPLDSVSWTSVRNGYTSKVFEVAKIVDPLLTSKPQMVLRERDPGDYDWAPENALPNSTTSLTVTPPVNYTVWSWAVSAVTLKDDSSADRRPAIKIVWNAANNDDIAGIAYKVRLASSGANVTSGTDRDGPVGEAIVEGPVLPNTTYQVKIKFISVSGREADWTSWENVTTDNVKITAPDLDDTLSSVATPANLATSSSLIGDGVALVVATWDAATNAKSYEVGVTRSGGNEVVLVTGDTRYEFESLPGISYSIRVRTISAIGEKSAWSTPEPVTAAADSTPPAVPTGLDVTPDFGGFWVEWVGVGDADLSHYELVYKSTSSTPGANPSSPIIETIATRVSISGLAGGVERYFWVRAVDTSKNKSAWSSPDNETTLSSDGAITTEDIIGLVDLTSFASGLTAVEVVSSLPTTGNFAGRTVVLTTDGKLYRYASGAWTAAVSSSDISGQLTNAQIASLAAAKITGELTNAQIEEVAAAKISGQLVASQIANGAVDITKLAAGITAVEVVSSLPGTGNFAGRTVVLTTDGKLYRYASGAWTAAVSSSDISGQLTNAQIASLAATKITGELTNAQIEEVAAAKLTGQIAGTQISDGAISTPKLAAGSVATDKLAAGSVVADKIASNAITAGKIDAGAVTTAKLAAGSVDTDKLAANAVVADKIASNAITTAKIDADAITAAKIAAGAVQAEQIDAGAVTAVKMGIGDFQNLNLDLNFTNHDSWNQADNGVTTFYRSVVNPNLWGGKNTLNLVEATNTYRVHVSQFVIDVNPEGEEFWFEGVGKITTSAGGYCYVDLQLSADDQFSVVAYAGGGDMRWTETVRTKETGSFSIPSGYRFAKLRVIKGNNGPTEFELGGLTIRRKNAGNLLVDGSIAANLIAAGAVQTEKLAASAVVADKIASNAITAGKIDAGAVTAAKIAAGAIETDKLAANAIVADKITANAITTAKIDADAITTAKISAGAVKADQIDAGAITASKVGIGDFTNLNNDKDFADEGAWNHNGIGTAEFVAASNPENWDSINYLKLTGTGGQFVQVTSERFNLDVAGEEFWVKANGKSQNGDGGGSVAIEAALDETFTGSSTYFGGLTFTETSITRKSGTIVVPAGFRYGRLRVYKSADGNTDARFGGIEVRRKSRGELIVDGAITADHVGANQIVTQAANILNGVITNAKIADLSAAKLTAGTALASSITVSGTALSTVESRAEDPAARINNKSTQIDPGKILIQGATTLSDWRKGGDLTKIDGGAISANTIDANKLTIGNRGVSVQNVQFEANSPGSNKVSWTSGGVRYVGDDGTSSFRSVTAGNATYSGSRLYIYFTKGNTDFSVSTDPTVAGTGDNIIVATYAGDTDLTVNFGQTIIDGDHIKTGTVQASHISVTDLSAISADLGTIEVDTANIANLAVTTLKINDVAVERDKLEDNAASDGGQTYEAAAEIASNGGSDIVVMSQEFGAISANQPLTFAASCEVRGQASPANGVRPRAWYRLSDSDSWTLFSDPGSYHTGTTWQGFGEILQDVFDAENFQIRITLLNQQPVGNISANNVRRKMIYARSLQR